MHRFIWYAKGKPRDQPKQLASFPGEWVGGAVCRTEDDIIHGVVLTQTGASKNFEYKWHRWTLTPPDKFEQSDPIKINCDGHYTMDRAVVSLRVPTGGPYAVMRSTAQGNPWIFVSPDGATKPMPPELREGPAPSRVLFRRNSDPTILYVLPERGFHFAKP